MTRTLFLALLALTLSAPAFAQDKKAPSKKPAAAKKAPAKKPSFSQDWSRFNQNSKGDLQKLEAEKKARQQKP